MKNFLSEKLVAKQKFLLIRRSSAPSQDRQIVYIEKIDLSEAHSLTHRVLWTESFGNDYKLRPASDGQMTIMFHYLQLFDFPRMWLFFNLVLKKHSAVNRKKCISNKER